VKTAPHCIVIRLSYLRELLRRLQMTMTEMIITRTMTMAAPTAPAIHATDNDNQLSVATSVRPISVVTAVHVVSPGHRKEHRSYRLFYAGRFCIVII